MARERRQNEFRMYSFHSQKGGVGKTSLAIAVAGLEMVGRRSRTLLIDADLTGTCLGDALGEDPVRFKPKKWFNDFLLAESDEFLNLTMGRGGWESFIAHPKVLPGLDVMQSDPDFDVVRDTIPTLAQEPCVHFYAERFERLMTKAAQKGYGSVILDLPPGLFGFSEAVLSMLGTACFADLRGNADNPGIRAQCVVVTTTDKADYRATLPATWLMAGEIDEDRRRDADEEAYGSAVRYSDKTPRLPRAGFLADGGQHCQLQVCINKARPMDGRTVLDAPLDIQSVLSDMRSLLASSARTHGPRGLYKKGSTRYQEPMELFDKYCKERSLPLLPDIPGFSPERILAAVVQARNKPLATLGQEGTMGLWIKGVARYFEIPLPGAGHEKII